MKQGMRTFWVAFLDGFTGAGLWGKLDIPGLPKQIFLTRSVDEIVASGEFDEILQKVRERQERDSSH